MIQQRTIPARAWAELVLLATIWGASFLCNRVALAEVGVLTIVAMRVLGGMALLWAYIVASGLSLPRQPRIWGAFLIMGLLNNAVPFTLIVWGQKHIESGLASILNASTAIFAILLAALILSDERLTWRKATGVAFGFCGVAVAIGLDALQSLDLTSLAQLAILGSSLSYACAGVYARIMFRGIAPQVVAAGMLTGSSLIMVPLALWSEGAPSLAYAASTWAALGYLAFVAAALAYLLYYRVLAMAGAGNLSIVTLLIAPIAIILGAVTFGEALPWQDYAGFALLALGLLILDGRIPAGLARRLHLGPGNGHH